MSFVKKNTTKEVDFLQPLTHKILSKILLSVDSIFLSIEAR